MHVTEQETERCSNWFSFLCIIHIQSSYVQPPFFSVKTTNNANVNENIIIAARKKNRSQRQKAQTCALNKPQPTLITTHDLLNISVTFAIRLQNWCVQALNSAMPWHACKAQHSTTNRLSQFSILNSIKKPNSWTWFKNNEQRAYNFAILYWNCFSDGIWWQKTCVI